MRLNDLIAGLGIEARWGRPPEEITLEDATLALEEVRPGVLFIARQAWYGDTHAQIEAAAARGAAAVLVSRLDTPRPEGIAGLWAPREDPTLGLLCDRLYGEPTRHLRVFGVTGTNGKTSTTWLLEHLLTALGRRPALMGTVEYRLGARRVPATNTTPDALVIHRFARDALRLGASDLVLEVSSHGLALERVAGVRFDAVGFTNLTRDHLDFHGDMDAYRDAKRRLFGPCLAWSRDQGKRPVAVACAGDEGPGFAQAAADVGADAWLLGGAPPDGPWRRATLRTGPPRLRGGTPMTLRLQSGEEGACALPLLGQHNAENAALAALLLEAAAPGALPAALEALASAPAPPGRLEPALPPGAAPLDALIDYAHTPDAVTRALTAARAATSGPLIALLGCGGERDRGKRPLMAAAALAAADHVVLTSDNPRSEDPDAILQDMRAGVLPQDARRVTVQPDRARAIADALLHAPPHALLLALGKGHEPYQLLGARACRLDDAEEARRALLACRDRLPPDAVPLCAGWSPRRLAYALNAPPDADLRAWPLAALTLSDDAGTTTLLPAPTYTHTLHLCLPDRLDALTRLAAEVVRALRDRPTPPAETPHDDAPPRDLEAALLRLASRPADEAPLTLPHHPPLLDLLRAQPPAPPSRIPTRRPTPPTAHAP